jgi:hypothetical protein
MVEGTRPGRPTGALWAEHVSGKMTAGERDTRLRQLKAVGADERGVLANARCLTEGVDVPTLDGVAFIDPRRRSDGLPPCWTTDRDGRLWGRTPPVLWAGRTLSGRGERAPVVLLSDESRRYGPVCDEGVNASQPASQRASPPTLPTAEGPGRHRDLSALATLQLRVQPSCSHCFQLRLRHLPVCRDFAVRLLIIGSRQSDESAEHAPCSAHRRLSQPRRLRTRSGPSGRDDRPEPVPLSPRRRSRGSSAVSRSGRASAREGRRRTPTRKRRSYARLQLIDGPLQPAPRGPLKLRRVAGGQRQERTGFM